MRNARWCEEHKRWECTHPRSRGRGTCHGCAVTGTAACRMHLGETTQAVAARVQAQQACEALNVPVRTTAAEALQDALAAAYGRVQYLRRAEAELGGDKLTWGTQRRTMRFDPETGQPQPVEVQQGAGVHPLSRLLQDAEDRLAKIATEMARLGIEQRTIRVQEAQVVLLRRALDGIFSDLGYDPNDPRLGAICKRRLLELAE